MWVSSVKKTSNQIIVKHIQRGYPLKPLDKKMNKKQINLEVLLKFLASLQK